MENTKKKLYEAQKNYLVCAVLMIIVGILMLYMKKNALGIGIIAFGVVFLIGFFVLLAKDGMMEVVVEEKASGKEKTDGEEQSAETGNSETNEKEEPVYQQEDTEAAEKKEEGEINQTDDAAVIEHQSDGNISSEQEKADGEKE